MSNLYELTQELKETQTMLNSMFESGEIDQETLKDSLDSLGGEVDEKIANIGRYINSELNVVKGIDEVIKNAQARKKTALNAIDRLKEYTINMMKQLDIKKVTESDIIVSTRKSKKVIVDDEEKALKKYGKKTEVIKYSLADIKKDIENCDFAHIQENTNLNIK